MGTAMSPKQPPHQSIALETARKLKSLLDPPKPRRSRKKLGPIKTRAQFEAVHQQVQDTIFRYAASKRSNYKALQAFVARDMHEKNARYLKSNNMRARVNVAESVIRHMETAPALQIEPLYFLTFVSREYVVSLPEALAMPHDELNGLVFGLQQLVRQALQGISFVGMVEAALYKDWTVDGPRRGCDSVHWHVHAIVFGRNLRQISQAVRIVRKRHRNIYGGHAVHCKPISVKEIPLYVRYMMKAPLKEYRLHHTKGEKIDRETGEVFVRFGVRQTKRDLRTGDRVQLANLMRDLLIDKLLFGGGTEGAALAKAIKFEAHTQMRLERTRVEARGGVWRI